MTSANNLFEIHYLPSWEIWLLCEPTHEWVLESVYWDRDKANAVADSFEEAGRQVEIFTTRRRKGAQFI